MEEYAQNAGIGYEDFWAMTYRSLVNRVRGYIEGQEAKQRDEWERVRWQTAYLLSVYSKKGQSLGVRDLITFPWEESEAQTAKVVDLEQMRDRWAKWDQKLKRERDGS